MAEVISIEEVAANEVVQSEFPPQQGELGETVQIGTEACSTAEPAHNAITPEDDVDEQATQSIAKTDVKSVVQCEVPSQAEDNVNEQTGPGDGAVTGGEHPSRPEDSVNEQSTSATVEETTGKDVILTEPLRVPQHGDRADTCAEITSVVNAVSTPTQPDGSANMRVHVCAVYSCEFSCPAAATRCKLHKCSYGTFDCKCKPQIKFFPFPLELEDRTRWIHRTKRDDLLMSGPFVAERYHICQRHFSDLHPTGSNPDPVLNLSPVRQTTDLHVEKDSPPKPSLKNGNSLVSTARTAGKVVRNLRPPKRHAQASSESESSTDESESSTDESDANEGDRTFCPCGLANNKHMIGCDGKDCPHEWFHFHCVGINPKKVPRGKWYCNSCQAKREKNLNVNNSLQQKLRQVSKEVKSKASLSAASPVASSVASPSAWISNHHEAGPILTPMEEQRLVEKAESMFKLGRIGLIKKSILSSIQVLLEVEKKNGINRSQQFQGSCPSDSWWRSFCQRHPAMDKMQLCRPLSSGPRTDLKNVHAPDSRQTVTGQNADIRKLKKKPRMLDRPTTTTTINKGVAAKSPKNKKHLKLGRSFLSAPPTDPLGASNSPTNKKQSTGNKPDGSRPLAGQLSPLFCLESVLLKPKMHQFRTWFERGYRCEDDVFYSAWKALKLLYDESNESEQEIADSPGGDVGVPAWSPFRRGPYYKSLPANSTSVFLAVRNPGKMCASKAMSRITSMASKKARYLEPWRFSIRPRTSSIRPRTSRRAESLITRVQRRNRRKGYLVRHFDGNYA